MWLQVRNTVGGWQIDTMVQDVLELLGTISMCLCSIDLQSLHFANGLRAVLVCSGITQSPGVTALGRWQWGHTKWHYTWNHTHTTHSTQQGLIYPHRSWAAGSCYPCHCLLPSHNLLLPPSYWQLCLLFSSKLSQLTGIVQNSAVFSAVTALLQNKCVVFLMWAKIIESVYGSHGLTAFLILSSDEWKKTSSDEDNSEFLHAHRQSGCKSKLQFCL